MNDLYYKPSGTVPIAGIITAVVISLITSIGLTIAYIALQWFIPFIYFNFFITFGLGFCIPLGVNLGLGIGKVRSPKTATILATICALFVFYAQWVLFISLMYNASGSMGGGTWVRSSFNLDGFLYAFSHPEIIFKAILELNEVGTISIKHNIISGGFLWFIWVIEAVLIIFIPMLMASSGKASQPFSEQNNKWMKKRDLDGKIKFVENKGELERELSSGNFKILKEHLTEVGDAYATVSIHESPGDQKRYLTVTNISHTVNSKGETKKNDKVIIEHFLITDLSF
ncbi:hypothetical protein [Pedobacter paludis]|uniref:Uncharacterized protein n=1 Tax=Pedobacter paludis TaxID=2203212 RepID=A0A317EZ62_9SPHI|nr:hypothetical protein [Pedobacter paludis]PWS32134.1 hypothetical protein DF947_10190 [Pedobacter paludis]